VADRERMEQKRAASLIKSASTSSPIDAALYNRPSPDSVDEQWARAIVRKGLPLDLVDDLEFRKAILMTAKAGLSYTHTDRAGKNDSKLPHRTKMTTVCIPELEVKLEMKIRKRLNGIVADTGGPVWAC